jgi:hypothetical protein
MGLANDMKKLSEEILDSYKRRAEKYQQRLKENESLMSDVQETLDGLRKSHLEMAANLHANAAALRDNLNKEEQDRLNAFENLMAGIRGSILSIQEEVETIQQSTANLLDSFSASRSQMSTEQNEKFEQARSDRHNQDIERLKDFDALMGNIQNDISKSKTDVNTILTDTNNLLKKFSEEHAEMTVTMRNGLNDNLQERVEYTRELLKTFHDRLTDIGNDNKKMAEALRKELLQSRKNLSENDAKRLNDFDQSMGKIRNRVSQIQNSVAEVLNDLSNNRAQAAEEWKKISETIAHIKSSAEATFKPEQEVSDKEPASVKNKEENEKEAPVAENGALSDDEEEKTMNLEEKIIAYINAHPQGVKVSEMEVPLGEQRMRIGYVCKKLFEEGKLQKLENTYFPKTEKNG